MNHADNPFLGQGLASTTLHPLGLEVEGAAGLSDAMGLYLEVVLALVRLLCIERPEPADNPDPVVFLGRGLFLGRGQYFSSIIVTI